MKRACVIGWPIEQSRSPLIHGYWLAAHGIDGRYTREPVPPDQLTAFLDGLAAHNFAGCNVTVPHKEAAFAHADVRHADAAAVGAANTFWLEAGRLHATNTDTYGYMTYLAARQPNFACGGARVMVLGAGGSARAIVYGLVRAGAAEVCVVNRSLERAQALAVAFGAPVSAVPWAEANAALAGVSLLINTTTLGMNGSAGPDIDLDRLPAHAIVSDIVYVPLITDLLARAQARGLATVDGLGMLLHQAVPGFERWFGVRPEVTGDLYRRIAATIAG